MKIIALVSLITACGAPPATTPTLATPVATETETKQTPAPAAATTETKTDVPTPGPAAPGSKPVDGQPAPGSKASEPAGAGGKVAGAQVEATSASVVAAPGGAGAAGAGAEAASGGALVNALKLTDPTCTDPDLAKVAQGVTFMLCNGTIGAGTYVAPVVPAQPDLTNLASGNVKQGVVINGVTGTYAPTIPTQPDLSNLSAGNVKLGVSINGVTGTWNGPTPPDLTNLSAGNVKLGVVIAGVTGSYDHNIFPYCSADGQTNCIAGGNWAVADTTQAVPSFILSGHTVAGVAGSLTPPTAGTVKAGVTVLGILGQYPSVSYPLPASSGTALTAATMNARLQDSSTTFEWYDAAGVRYTGSGDANLVAGNIGNGTAIFGVTGTLVSTAVSAQDVRVGVTINGVAGALKVSCRNNRDTTHYASALSVIDYTYGNGFPAMLATGATSANDCDGTNWTDQTGTGLTCDDTDCLLKDKTSGLQWTKTYAAATWTAAKTACSGLTFHGITGWRLPSEKELMAAYVDGMAAPLLATGIAFTDSTNFWSSTDYTLGSGSDAIYVAPVSGFSGFTAKTGTNLYVCVH